MTPEQIQEYLILKEQQAYHAEKEKQKTYRIAILAFFVTILICFGIYFVVPEVSTGASMAKDFLLDKDAPSNKIVRYLKAMHE